MNIGTLDRVIRIVLGLALVLLTYFQVIGAWGFIGLIPLITGVIKWCPLYTILGVQTCPVHSHIKYK